MGNGWKKLLKKFGVRDVRVLMVGLDAAGKTSLLYQMKLGEFVTTIPSTGLNVETISHGKTKFVTWDVGGRDKIRPLWRHYYQNTEALLFVVDSTDHERIVECKEELWRFLKEDELKDAVVLVMANKQDLPNAMSPTEVAEKLEVHKLDRTIYVQGTSAGTGEGLQQSLSWVQDTLIKRELKSSLVEPVKESLPKIDNKQTHSHTWWSIISNYFHSTPTISS